MAKITTAIVENFIKNTKIELKSSHKKLSIPIINRIYHKMMIGINFSEIKISDNIIIDGHHRYISSLLAGINIEFIDYQRTSATTSFDWQNVTFVDEEWDTDLKIKQLNISDAAYNNIDLKILSEITK